MVRIAYQPCSNSQAQANLIKTIHNPVPMSRLSGVLDSVHLEQLHSLYPEGEFYVWGVNENSNTRRSFDELSPGDIALFNIKTVLSISAVVTYKLKSKKAAVELWGFSDHKDESTWDCLYFLDRITYQSIPYERAFEGCDKKPRIPFTLVDQLDSERVLLNTDLGTELADIIERPSLSDARKEILEQSGTDGTSETTTRKEHAFIVRHLFGTRKEGVCCICNQTFPRNYLVAAHLKKRAKCSDNERLDIENIAAPMCRFGCDTLYETGAISVNDEGYVVIQKSKIHHESIQIYTNSLAGQKCGAFNKRTKKYFTWHRRAHGLEALPGSKT